MKYIIKAEKFFDYSDMASHKWNELVHEAIKTFHIHFDLENNDSTKQEREIIIPQDEWEFTKCKFKCALWRAGGDWEVPIYYFRCQLIDGYAFDVKKYGGGAGMFIYIPRKEEGNYHLVKPKANSEDWWAPDGNTYKDGIDPKPNENKCWESLKIYLKELVFKEIAKNRAEQVERETENQSKEENIKVEKAKPHKYIERKGVVGKYFYVYQKPKKEVRNVSQIIKDFPFKVLTPEGNSLGVYQTEKEAQDMIHYASSKFPDVEYKRSFKIVPSEKSDFIVEKARIKGAKDIKPRKRSLRKIQEEEYRLYKEGKRGVLPPKEATIHQIAKDYAISKKEAENIYKQTFEKALFVLQKAKKIYVPASLGRKAYHRMDPRMHKQEKEPKEEYEIKKPWEMTPYQYQAMKGIHQPWIAEISPFQFSRMSERQKKQYEAKRSVEWQASADVKIEWKNIVIDAYEKGLFTLDDPNILKEVKDAIQYALRKKAEEKLKESFEQAWKENSIKSMDEVKIGDRVFDIMTRRYGTIDKKFKNSVKLRLEEPITVGPNKQSTEMTVNVRQLQRKSFDDLKSDFEKAFIIKKAEVQPFTRTRLGKLERVKGWFKPAAKISSYEPNTKGVMNFIKDHMGIQEYSDISANEAKKAKYREEAVANTFLEVTDKAKDTLYQMIQADKEGLKKFMIALYGHIQHDILLLREDLRKSNLYKEEVHQLTQAGKKEGEGSKTKKRIVRFPEGKIEYEGGKIKSWEPTVYSHEKRFAPKQWPVADKYGVHLAHRRKTLGDVVLSATKLPKKEKFKFVYKPKSEAEKIKVEKEFEEIREWRNKGR